MFNKKYLLMELLCKCVNNKKIVDNKRSDYKRRHADCNVCSLCDSTRIVCGDCKQTAHKLHFCAVGLNCNAVRCALTAR